MHPTLLLCSRRYVCWTAIIYSINSQEKYGIQKKWRMHLEWKSCHASRRSTRRDACSMSFLHSRCLHFTITFNNIAAWDWDWSCIGLSVEQPIHSNFIIRVQRECIRVSFNEDRPALGLVGLLTRPSIMILGGDWETLHLRASRIGGGWQGWLESWTCLNPSPQQSMKRMKICRNYEFARFRTVVSDNNNVLGPFSIFVFGGKSL